MDLGYVVNCSNKSVNGYNFASNKIFYFDSRGPSGPNWPDYT
jgi:hypothetical protein